ncbi:hypothetical protein RFI_22865 [Reticulomyxa filosa]|uniref:Protein kinase domain-containing protein n=1 Tax=Reticulomyxa filosa TaxID=46433 RepID=X6MN36_RETFI|nr:hypothetical protein RFI_22865 [Reticulomyxa filosa]|eukprot:ETO14505.1 hypothetical protein RFI_22865 [Reticulomyxa filosa]
MEKLIHIHKYVAMHPFDVWILFFQLLHAISYVHSVCKVMHLDFKPNNIMINSYKLASIKCERYTLVKLVNPRVTLIDFSVSTKAPRDVDLDEYPCRGQYGTRRYRAPEMIFGGLWNRSIDTFALALIALECINLTRIMENKYRGQDGRRFQRLKDDHGRKAYEKKEVVDYIVRMAKTFMGKPSQQYLDSCFVIYFYYYFFFYFFFLMIIITNYIIIIIILIIILFFFFFIFKKNK